MTTGSTVLYNYEGMWIRVLVTYTAPKGRGWWARIKWIDKEGQHIDEVGIKKLVPLTQGEIHG